MSAESQFVKPGPPASSNRPSSVTGLSLASSDGGGGSPWIKILLATVIVVLAIAGYVYFGEKPPVVTGEVTHLTAYPIHRVSNAALNAAPRAAKVEQTFDQIVVVAAVRLRNQSDGPLFLSDVSALVSTMGEEHRSLAASASDFDRVFVAYPQLLPMKQSPLLLDTTILSGETVEGQLIFNYPLTKEQWDLRRSLDLTASFLHQKDLTMPAPQ